MNMPRIVDNDRDEITAVLDGREIRGWSYKDAAERRTKMLAAREFAEGWYMVNKKLEPAIKALRAHYAWSYCEQHGLGSFEQRGVLCAHAEYLTAKALAAAEGVAFDKRYEGLKRLIVWPQVRLEESDEAEAEALVAQAIEHERNAAMTA